MPRSQRREQLLGHARRVFAANGYHNASMDDIAERAGVSKPVLYQHFPGKLELYLVLLDEAVDQVRDLVLRHATVEAYFGFISAPDSAFRLVFESDLTNEPEPARRVAALHADCAQAVALRLREVTRMDQAQSQLAAIGLVGLAQVSARAWFTSATLTREQAVDLISTFALRGLRGFQGPGPAADGAGDA